MANSLREIFGNKNTCYLNKLNYIDAFLFCVEKVFSNKKKTFINSFLKFVCNLCKYYSKLKKHAVNVDCDVTTRKLMLLEKCFYIKLKFYFVF